MIDDTLREVKEKVLSPLACEIGKHVHPMTITLASAVFGVAAGVLAAGQAYLAGLTFWFVNRALDGLDGTVARLHHRQSDLGAYIDIVVDFIAYAAIPIGLVLGKPNNITLIALIFMFGIFYVNTVSWAYLSALLERRALGAATEHKKTSITMPTGLVEGTETIVFYTLFFLFPDALVTLFMTMSFLTAISTVQRIVWAVRHLA